MIGRGLNFWKNLGSRVKQHIKQWTKPVTTTIVTGTLSDMIRSRADLIAENAMLRQQLIVLNRQVKRPQLTNGDRIRLVLLARCTQFWQQALHIVQPDTLLRWHRDLFRRHWRRKSKNKKRKPRIAQETIDLIRQMAKENRLWGAERIRGDLLNLCIKVIKRTVQKLSWLLLSSAGFGRHVRQSWLGVWALSATVLPLDNCHRPEQPYHRQLLADRVGPTGKLNPASNELLPAFRCYGNMTRDASSKIGDAGVRMMEPTEYTYRRDSARLRMVFLVESSGDALTDALTGSGVVVVICEFGDEAMQLVAVENKHMVQTFPFTAANEALAVGVGLGGLEWCPQLLDAAAGSNGEKRRPYLLSRSRMRYLGASPQGVASRNCWAVQSSVGERVTAVCTIRRVISSMTTKM